ncbi:MAG: hypothetical protein K2J80_06150 [Oscillospiraceae bacterium]|nr:hypothetical protein [Oscillospiraceae bacterium]
MAVLYNLEPLAAMDLFYDGEKNGVWNGDFIKNEKQNGLVLPPVLREFLEKYAFLDMNKGQIIFFHPDYIREICLPTDGDDVHILVIGRADELFIGIELGTKDLDIAFGDVDDDTKHIMWGPTDGITLVGIMRVMFVSMLFKSADKFLFQGAEIDAVLKKHGAARSAIVPSEGSTQHTSINFDEENGAFLIAEFDESGEDLTFLHVVPRKSYEQRKAERFASVTLDELNSLFEAEFYMNALHCDFAHALDIKLEIVKRMEQSGAEETELEEHYRLVGRCLWALNRLDEAAEWYGKAGAIVAKSGDPKKIADYYHTMANFYADTRQWDKSNEMYDKALSILKEHFPDNVYDIGMIYRSMSDFLDSADGDPDRIIELCNLALEQFQKDPHDSGCKYEIARAQQLRGKAKRRKKELLKNSGQ